MLVHVQENAAKAVGQIKYKLRADATPSSGSGAAAEPAEPPANAASTALAAVATHWRTDQRL